ncbi:hypothetical protein R50072_27830 [Simiduia litorea]|uniref:polysaccharide lyase family 7 protein n=1 Tax=Simiduia litorea TaxID=1435348 RepID=UPI0036F3A5E6
MKQTPKRQLRPLITLALVASCAVATASDIVNASFEESWQGWTQSTGNLSISNDARTGAHSLKLSSQGAFAAQTLNLAPNTKYQLSAYLLGAGTLGVKSNGQLFFDQPKKRVKEWTQLAVVFESSDNGSATIFASFAGTEGRFDDFNLTAVNDNSTAVSAKILPSTAGGTGLSPDLPPGRNFDLLGWYLNTPGDENDDGICDRFDEVDLAKGATDSRYFYTAPDGGMVFKATVAGAKTSKNTKFTRTELREMLRRGDKSIKTKADAGPNKNNWVFSSAPTRIHKLAGGIDGRMEATLAVNAVTTTGDAGQVGRVIVGQIHADRDEPVRLYYRKLPQNTRGSIYFAHEPSRGHGDEQFIELIGSKSNSASDPEKGFALNEKFSYVIDVKGNTLLVEISQNGKTLASKSVDMTHSGYNVASDYMYFKAGVYNQNSTGNPEDFVQATFYRLNTSHTGYKP